MNVKSIESQKNYGVLSLDVRLKQRISPMIQCQQKKASSYMLRYGKEKKAYSHLSLTLEVV